MSIPLAMPSKEQQPSHYGPSPAPDDRDVVRNAQAREHRMQLDALECSGN